MAMDGRTCFVALLGLMLSGAGALNVNIPDDLYERARGDNITLPCSFQTKLSKPPLAIISWSLEGVQANAEETLILTHYYPAGTTDIKKRYEGRVSVDVDIAKGKADLKMSSITLADNKNFECRVQIPGDDEGKPADTARLVVLVAPSTPICTIQGNAEYGKNINLTCLSEEGSPTPTYSWESKDVRSMPRVPDPRTTDKGGILSLYNISKDTSGFYICTSRNKIRSASCNITLAVMPPSMNVGSTAGIICGVVAALVVLIVVIYCCCCRKKKQEEEYVMGVPEKPFADEEPAANGETRRTDAPEGYDDSRVESPTARSDRYEERSERNYDDRRSDYDDRRSDYDDRRSDYTDRRDNSDRREYSDRHERYDDERRYDDSRERRYDEPADDQYPDRANDKPARRDYDD